MFYRGKGQPLQTNEQPPRIYLVEGEHFRTRHSNRSMFNAIARELGQFSLEPSVMLVAGYDAAHDKSPDAPIRTRTFAVPFSEFKRDAKALRHPWPLNTFKYARIISTDPDKGEAVEPAIGIYDRRMLQVLTRGGQQFGSPAGSTLGDAQLVEFHLVRRGEDWRLPLLEPGAEVL